MAALGLNDTALRLNDMERNYYLHMNPKAAIGLGQVLYSGIQLEV